MENSEFNSFKFLFKRWSCILCCLNRGVESNFRGCSSKKPQRNTIICRFLQGIWLHTQREDGATPTIYPKKPPQPPSSSSSCHAMPPAQIFLTLSRHSSLSSIASKHRSCQYCYIDALHGRWQRVWRKSLTAITQESCKLYWTSLGSNTPQKSSYMATYLPSRKPSKLDESDMQKTAGEVRTNS